MITNGLLHLYALPHEDKKMITDLIYLSEAIATSTTFFDVVIGIFLWYSDTRFQAECEKFMEATTTVEEFDLRIIKHQELTT